MKILSIGNSFSDDAQRYLREIAAAEGVEIETLNLCIGGCSLETHASHVKDGAKAYFFHYNGDVERNPLTEFNSNNTQLLNVEETKAKIAALAYIQKELAKGTK